MQARYKMYKSGKHWVYASMLTVGALMVMQGASVAHADSAPTETTQTVTANNVTSQSNTQEAGATASQSEASPEQESDKAKQSTKTTEQHVQSNVATTSQSATATSTDSTSASQPTQSSSAVSQSNQVRDNNTSAQEQSETTQTPQMRTDNNTPAVGLSTNHTTQQTQDNRAQATAVTPTTNNTTSTNNTSNTTITPETNPAYDQNYHLENNAGFMNDVQSIFQTPDGTWHMYYLEEPGVKTGASNWQHATSKDMVNWTNDTGLAIKSHTMDNSVPWGTVATGSAIISDGSIKGTDKGDIVAYFASYGAKGAGGQSIWAAVSKDNGKTYQPLYSNAVMPNTQNYPDFRDPKVIKMGNKYVMYLAEGLKVGTYNSTDGQNWTYVGGTMMDHYAYPDDKDHGAIECPYVTELTASDGTKHAIMFVGDNDYNHGGTTGTSYYLGTLDANGVFTKDPDFKEPVRFDLGTDYYGANFGQLDSKTLTSTAWVNNWAYATPDVKDENGNEVKKGTTTALNRFAILAKTDKGYRLNTQIASPFNASDIKTSSSDSYTLNGSGDSHTETIKNATEAYYSFDTVGDETITIDNDQTDNDTKIILNIKDGTISVQRDSKGNIPGAYNSTTLPVSYGVGAAGAKNLTVHVFYDTRSIEIAFPDYGTTFTSLKWAKASDNGIKTTISSTGQTGVTTQFKALPKVNRDSAPETPVTPTPVPQPADDTNKVIDDLKNQIAELQKELADAQSEHAKDGDMITGLQNQINDLTKQLNDSRQTSNNDNQTINDLKNQIASLQEALVDAQSSHASDDTTITNLQSQIATLTKQLEEKQKASVDDEQTITNLNNQIAGLQKALTDAQNGHTKDEATIVNLQTQLNNLTKQLDDSRQSSSNDSQTINDLKNQITSLKAQIADLQNSLTESQTTHANDSETIQKLTAQIAELQKALAEAQNRQSATAPTVTPNTTNDNVSTQATTSDKTTPTPVPATTSTSDAGKPVQLVANTSVAQPTTATTQQDSSGLPHSGKDAKNNALLGLAVINAVTLFAVLASKRRS